MFATYLQVNKYFSLILHYPDWLVILTCFSNKLSYLFKDNSSRLLFSMVYLPLGIRHLFLQSTRS